MLLSSLILLLSSQSVFAFASPPQAPRPPAMVAAAATGAGALAPAAELHGALVAYDGDAQLKARIESALRVLEDAFRVFGGDAVYASFNGGQDARVILHLLRAARHARALKAGASPTPRLVFFDASDDFDEQAAAPGVRAGHAPRRPELRRPEGLRALGDWMPPFMRVNPILDWTYGDVWAFLRAFDLPYCALYDGGYTSLERAPRPEPGASARGGAYKPAHLLEDWSLERAGRVSKKKPSD
ncbi:hypothetical protein JL720_14899 [Aureococcus anophagefferens]|nr:hypothetical protein JL720_14899 [Aureococcus anophagefferens]